MLSSGFHRKLYYGKEVYYCLKDVLYSLQLRLSNSMFVRLTEIMDPKYLYSIEELECKYSVPNFKFYVQKELNNNIIEYFRKHKKSYQFINERYINELLKIIDYKDCYVTQKLDVINCLKKVFKDEVFYVNQTIYGHEVEFYLVDYNLIVQQETTYNKLQMERNLEKALKCTFLHYNPYFQKFDVFELIGKIFNFIQQTKKRGNYNDYYYYYY